MPVTIVPGEFCASYFGIYEVEGSNGATYTVSWDGGESPAHCTCKAYEFFRGPETERRCKHIDRVWAEGCFWNCQWHEGNAEVKRRPDPDSISQPIIEGSECPNCGGPLVPVRIAV